MDDHARASASDRSAELPTQDCCVALNQDGYSNVSQMLGSNRPDPSVEHARCIKV